MKTYHKINTIWKRDQQGKLLEGQWSRPEFEYLKDNAWVFTEKVDGTNIRVMWDGIGQITFGGKTDNAQMPAGLVAALNNLFLGGLGLKYFSENWKDVPCCLYGEGYGAKIQKIGGNYKADGQDFVLFDVRVGHLWLDRDSVADIATQLGLRVVPVYTTGTLQRMVDLVRDDVLLSHWGPFKAEGLIGRPVHELLDRRGERIITKLKAVDFHGTLEAVESASAANTR